ncbi:P-loop containing nucleoside triphosphate hydrolase protein [Dunaliella salina]|uniref:P-loop containing nucleoside triphosphate hydrolase protein n=1 Tax=Dunaliella salina TaxID=3046 RepID=A0ABQ7GAB7_DUNSA|nr:P-loop containing nucleoside triphosphate hydrolase protein [Dunaliella salina]|eukprot:KAF5831549.1 P-loop containing nucleoside triphosphate hydrolase protein [Dunaliella salina]
MRGLSGGQKVKVVLGAAMWNNPHILVLDEPTNYLDRDSLGALAEAIKAYGGGVVMITHNKEFYSALTQETWMVADGKLTPTGQKEIKTGKDKEITKFEVQEETTDAYGNVIKVKAPPKLKMSNKEKKQQQKLREARKARGEEVTDSEED